MGEKIYFIFIRIVFFFKFLFRQRAKRETFSPDLHWRPSAKNPDGEIVKEVKPPPDGQFWFNSNKYI